MSVESARAFIRRLSEDKEFYDRVRSIPDPEDYRKAVKEAGYDFDRAEASQVLPPGITLEHLTAMESDDQEVPDELLEIVAGGGTLSNEDLELYFIFRKALE